MTKEDSIKKIEDLDWDNHPQLKNKSEPELAGCHNCKVMNSCDFPERKVGGPCSGYIQKKSEPEPKGTAKRQYMHESIKEDAVIYDMPAEEIIQALCEDNENIKNQIDHMTAENKKLLELGSDLNKSILAHLEKEKRLQTELKVKDALLKAAKCPNCNGDGAYYDNYGNVCQCQWCYEVEQALKGK